MLGLLLSGVGVMIFWIFKYDDWNPNPVIDDHHSNGDDEQVTELEIRAEPNPS